MGGRIEYKYLVPNHLLSAIRADIEPYLAPDPFTEAATRGEYSVRSIYYDTPGLACYHEKDAGVEERNKFRIRGYGTDPSNSIVFLEIKKRLGPAIDKHRASLRLADLPEFLAQPDIDRHIFPTAGAPRGRTDARRFLYYYYRLCLHPVVLVVYNREAFFGKYDTSLRVTFDKAIRGRLAPQLRDLHDESGLAPVMRDHFVLELKFFHNSLPQWASSLIQRYSLPRMALSKFALCLDLRDRRPNLTGPPRVLPPAGYASV
jgi:hypothetical protein